MPTFDSRYLDDEEIWSRVNELCDKKEKVELQLVRAETRGETNQITRLSKRLDELKKISALKGGLATAERDLKAAKELREEENDPDVEQLLREIRGRRDGLSEKLLSLLLDGGYVDEEKDDPLEAKILKYIDSLGPEYALKLGESLHVDVSEVRELIDSLMKKGLLKRVEGTTLESYHRQEGWDKHMNHTYYELTREGDHFLRESRRPRGSGGVTG
ncbi:DUF2250 domain-containing protein [Candidatus Bipolaricaulota bacterium]|nr:DUF2250 domain-containing protein [Candidatus Bipolaricaulota bacterium]